MRAPGKGDFLVLGERGIALQAIQSFHRTHEAQVTGGKNIGVAKPEHKEHLGRPWANTPDRD